MTNTFEEIPSREVSGWGGEKRKNLLIVGTAYALIYRPGYTDQMDQMNQIDHIDIYRSDFLVTGSGQL